MADLGRYLPLSNKPRVDESAVSADWGARLAELEAAVGDAGPDAAAAFAHARSRTRVRIGDLALALLAAYESGREFRVDPVTSGAVALARAAAAPLPVRAVVRGRTLRATDAGWELGSGPELAGTARELIMLLYGRGPVPGA